MYPIVFVSLGPGESDLITLKGLKALQTADCIFYPATILKDGAISSRALDIMMELDIDKKKTTPFYVPMNKDRSLAIDAYNRVSEEAKQQYLKGMKVIIVAEGDAGFYSSIHYIFDTLVKQNIPVEHVAGIPAFIACGALAGIHIVKQEEELNVIPGITSARSLIDKISSGKVVVIMKASQCEQAVKESISAIPTAAFHYFENVGVKGKEYYTCDTQEIISRKFPYFSLMIIHQ